MELNEVTPQYPPTHYPVITPRTDKPSAIRSVTPGMCVYVCTRLRVYVRICVGLCVSMWMYVFM